MTDCTSPKCHEALHIELKDKPDYETFNELKNCVSKKVSKKVVLWGISTIVPLIIILGGIGIKGWSQQEADHLKYAQKEDMIKIQVVVEHLADDLKEMRKDFKDAQGKAQKDREEILRRLER